jgi:hypothetical protein
VTGEIEQESEQGLGVGIIEVFEIKGCRHVLW